MKIQFFFGFLFIWQICESQHLFSGHTNPENRESKVYLSIIEDYRKMDGVYAEQIIAQTKPDSTGYFSFSGDILESKNKIYSIHIDKCSEENQAINHFNGHCDESQSMQFIAKNTDTIEFPLSYDKEMFCEINSSNPKTNAIFRIDSLKNEMRFAYSEVKNEVSKKLNDKKWLRTLQNFGKKLNDPLAEVAIYAYLSDRTGLLHRCYLEDLATNNYYQNLSERLESKYPNSTYTKQYNNELEADLYLVHAYQNKSGGFNWTILIYILLFISILTNIFLLYQNRKRKFATEIDLKDKLSKQEQVVLDLILQNKSNKDIAESLFLSLSTIKTHINNIYKKLDVASREEVKSLFAK
jgi:DNA-binding CsgD family transcriptional regulator